MFLVLWEFEVKPGNEERFERVYGAGGDWDSLFRRDSNHAGTYLFRDTAKPRVYLTADYWVTQTAYKDFLQREEAEYKRIDAEAEVLTVAERHVGSYETAGKIPPTDWTSDGANVLPRFTRPE
jgi:Antibiotic biosynthesis monooxygenase